MGRTSSAGRRELSMQPDDGADVEDEGEGEDFDEDLEME
jgi:hypothetical protein